MLLKWCYTVAMKQEQDRKQISTNTRYPQAIHEAMKRLAKKHNRSFNAEVIWALQEYIEQEEKKGK